MGLARLLSRPTPNPVPVALRAAPEVRTAGSTFEVQVLDFTNTFGIAPWETSNYRGYLSIPGAWRASVMISDLFAQMPFHSYRYTAGGEVPTPKNAPILEAPAGGYEDPLVVMAAWGMDYLWEGNAVGVYATRNSATGLPTSVLPVPASSVGVRIVPENDSLGGIVGRKEYAINGWIFDQSEIFHVKGPCKPGDVRGMGVLETQLTSLRLASDLEQQADAISQHGVPTGVLKSQNPEQGPDDLRDAKAGWLESQRTRTIAALGANIDFQPLSWNPEEMQLIEARKFSLTQLELMFGLPVGWLGGQQSSRTYSNVEQDAVNLIKFSALAGMIAKFESVFTVKTLPRGQSAKGNRDAVLRSDTMTRYQAHASALKGQAWKTINEVRAIENLDPIEGGDQLLSSVPAAPAADPAPDPATDPTTGTGDNSAEGGTQ